MSMNVRTLTEDSSSYAHLRYNTLVKAGEPTIEYARFGSVLLNAKLASTVLAVALDNNPDLKTSSKDDCYKALNQGLRALIQSALKSADKRQIKTRGDAEAILRKQLPDLFTS